MDSGEQQQPTLAQLDTWCEQALSSPVPEQREEAERRLRYYFPTFSETPAEMSGAHGFGAGQQQVMAVFPAIKGPADAASWMAMFLRQSSRVFSLSYIVRRLRVLVLNHLAVMSNDQKTDLLGNALLGTIQEKFLELPPFLIDDTARALALVMMFTWFDLPESADVVDTVLEMAAASDKHQILALQMLRAFVEEFNKELPHRFISRQRRVVVTFRDKQLKSIFEHSLSAMRSAISRLSDPDRGREQAMVLSQALLVQRDCLAFDFIGLAPDESSDDAVAIQIPSTWKDIIQTDDFLDPYFDGYKRCSPPVSSQFVEVLVMIASIRRSFYMESVRVAFVKRMCSGIVEILTNGIGLDDVENYHHMHRLLARFRCIHTLIEIEDSPIYRELLAAVAAFSLTGLTLYEWSPNSIAPLLTFWSKVASTHDMRDNANAEISGDLIASTLPQIIREYMRAMILATMRVATGETLADNPLENVDALLDSMALVANIARSSYEACAPVILEIFREMAAKYQALLNSGQAGDDAVVVIEGQLAWPVYAVAQCISARQPYKSLPEDDRLDAEMFATGLELDRLVQQRIQSSITAPPPESLELAFLQMYQGFRASYIGEQNYKTNAVYAKLSSFVGLKDSSSVLELVLQKVLFNFRTWSSQSLVIQRSLQLFHDMSIGYVSVRQVAKLDTVKLLLANHSSEQFQFLRSIDEFKLRSQYYAGLARILFTGDATLSQFSQFMQPWAQAIDRLMGLSDAQLAQDSVRAELIRILRDLRGFLSAVSSKTNYILFFDWISAGRMRLVHRCLQIDNDPRVQVAALKFLAEFVYNRTQRLNFDVTSANGILIFREASAAIWEYGNFILKSSQPVRDVYKDRYKGVAVCFNVMMRLITGKYVAIGVMPLYGDTALEHAYGIVLELLKKLPVSDVIAYPKLGKATMSMLEALLAKNNIDLVGLDEMAYEQIMRLCVEAFDHAETTVSSHACSVIDNVLTSAIEGTDSGKHANAVRLVRDRPDIVKYLLRTLLNIVLFEDRPNDWSFSRPLFCLVVLDGDFALQHTSQIVQYQHAERREELIKALKDLFSAADFVLTTSNRDSFTQALTHYRREVTSKNLILMVPTNQTLGATVDIMAHDTTSKMSGAQGPGGNGDAKDSEEGAMAD
ncbi:hypothetical protein LPJ64_005217 [Coemansia asiatica]|uniref:Exportin-7/Ran-binding protein 17 TPR repeats domain-containing protein n=1 Tax=Coemansia asiatica TaxID=1052880 RepID=A0A9W7XGV7_9FUNG|nr:hypothetical protein LPJ64_005217 [Coemansia asiatica]